VGRDGLNRNWVLGTLETAPGILPTWLARLGPAVVPVPRTALRPTPAVRGPAVVRTPVGSVPLIASDGSAGVDLERLEQAIVTEQPYVQHPAIYRINPPVALRRRVARAEHVVRGLLPHRAAAAYSFAADAVAALWAYSRGLRTRDPWPDGRASAFLATHDVEGGDAADVLELARAEAGLGVRGTYFLVPTLWRDTSLPAALRDLGHEVACHGLDHSGRETYAPPGQLLAGARSLGLTGITGYRSPRFGCAHGYGDKIGCVFDYDSSRPETRRHFGGPLWSGCGTVFPFLDGRELVSLPVTLPCDLELLDEGRTWAQTVITWQAKWRLIREAGGLGTLCTHLPSRPGAVRAVVDFLATVRAEPSVWQGTAAQLVAFLRESSTHPGRTRPWREFESRPGLAGRRLPLLVAGESAPAG
jgi:hypothetical protein